MFYLFMYSSTIASSSSIQFNSYSKLINSSATYQYARVVLKKLKTFHTIKIKLQIFKININNPNIAPKLIVTNIKIKLATKK